MPNYKALRNFNAGAGQISAGQIVQLDEDLAKELLEDEAIEEILAEGNSDPTPPADPAPTPEEPTDPPVPTPPVEPPVTPPAAPEAPADPAPLDPPAPSDPSDGSTPSVPAATDQDSSNNAPTTSGQPTPSQISQTLASLGEQPAPSPDSPTK